jgi:hypothetical protein
VTDPRSLVEALVDGVAPAVLAQHRPNRAALVLPLLRALAGPLRGLRLVELGSGEPLLLAHALAEQGALVTAVDPCLADPRVAPGSITVFAEDALLLEPGLIAPADATVSTLLFGAPLRQRVRRELWPAYMAGERPGEDSVRAGLLALERQLLRRLAAWTRPGAWTVHYSLERLFAATDDDWRSAGFEPLPLCESPRPDTSGTLEAWARHVLGGFRVARRLEP